LGEAQLAAARLAAQRAEVEGSGRKR
jgi:hypothetical protein